MIRILLTSGKKAYGYDVTDWESKPSDWYDNLLTEDLVERVSEGDTLMYVGSNELAEEWCDENKYEYELVKQDEDK